MSTGRRVWAVLRVETADERAEELAGRLGIYGLGVEGRSLGGRTRLSAYFENVARARGAAAAVRAELEAEPNIELVEDGRWVERYRQSLQPLPLGQRFVVLPRPDLTAPQGREPIRLAPGRAFGTGEHPTTRLCAALLERLVEPGSRWIDLGTGTGILALVALCCGASEVTALDVDPEAVEVAVELARINGSPPGFRPVCGGTAYAAGMDADGMVANVSASLFETEAAALRRALRPGGVLAASGFLDSDMAAVVGALESAGFRAAASNTEGGWAAATLRAGERER